MPQVKVNAMSYAQLIKALMPGCFTLKELTQETGLHYLTVCEYTRELHKAGAVHITMWEKDSRDRDALRIYKLGPGKDATRSRLTQAQRQARARARQQMARLLNLVETV